MGSQTKYHKKDLVYVNAFIGPDEPGGGTPPTVKYGFYTNNPATDRTALGHIKIEPTTFDNPPTGLAMGCSFPKPFRASKRIALRFTSSYVDKAKVNAAKLAGYRIAKAKARTKLILAGDGKFVKSVYVAIRGIKYGWNIPKVTETNAGSLGLLKVIDATAADRDDLCFGSNFPNPPRAQKVTGTDAAIKTISTFYDPTVTAATGWELLGGGKLNLV